MIEIIRVDVDNKNKAFRTAVFLSNIGETWMRKSSSGKYHFICFAEVKNKVKFEDMIVTRLMAGDDINRIKYDIMKYRCKKKIGVDILFDWKNGKFAECWKPIDWKELNPVPFWRQRYKKEVKR